MVLINQHQQKIMIVKHLLNFQVQVIEPKVGRKKLKKMKQAEREKTKGEGWFNMKAPEMTPELQNELDVLRMRSAIDPTRFYKKLDSSAPPKYFQAIIFLMKNIFAYFIKLPF